MALKYLHFGTFDAGVASSSAALRTGEGGRCVIQGIAGDGTYDGTLTVQGSTTGDEWTVVDTITSAGDKVTVTDPWPLLRCVETGDGTEEQTLKAIGSVLERA